MQEIDVYSWDDNNYILFSKIGSYLYLSNEKNPRDIMIRKEDSNDPDLLLPLDDDNEFNKALELFYNNAKVDEI